jgi:hypothetical protein
MLDLVRLPLGVRLEAATMVELIGACSEPSDGVGAAENRVKAVGTPSCSLRFVSLERMGYCRATGLRSRPWNRRLTHKQLGGYSTST